MFVKITNGIIQSLKQQCGHGNYSPVVGFSFDCCRLLTLTWLLTLTVPVAIYDSCLTCPFYSTHIPMFTVLDPLLEFTYHLLSCWRKFALCIQSLLCMLFLSGWPPCQRSYMILMEVSQRAYDMIHYISGLVGYFYVCEIYVNLIWYLYQFMLNKLCLSLSLSLSLSLILSTCRWLTSPAYTLDLLLKN